MCLDEGDVSVWASRKQSPCESGRNAGQVGEPLTPEKGKRVGWNGRVGGFLGRGQDSKTDHGKEGAWATGGLNAGAFGADPH